MRTPGVWLRTAWVFQAEDAHQVHVGGAQPTPPERGASPETQKKWVETPLLWRCSGNASPPDVGVVAVFPFPPECVHPPKKQAANGCLLLRWLVISEACRNVVIGIGQSCRESLA